VDSEWAEIYITANSGNIYSFSIWGIVRNLVS
jgi:hypothetical protein